MKKFILFILLLIPYPVFAYDLINISDTENIMLEPMQNQFCSTVGGTCEIKLSVSQNYWTTHSLNLNRHNVIIYAPLINVEYHGDNIGFWNYIYKQNDMYNFNTLSMDGINQLYKRYVRVSQTYYDNNIMTFCDINDYSIMCKLEGSQIKEVSYSIFEIHTIEDTRISGRIAHNAILGNYNNTYSVVNSINNQTQQQQQQFNQMIDSNNSTNQSDFVSFATNYFIDDKTGTKSFLNIVPNFLSQLDNGSCTPLTITIPFISRNNQLTIPCMVNFLGEHGFGNLIRIYQFVISFIVAYWLTVNWFKLFKETIDPFNYRIEVMDL